MLRYRKVPTRRGGELSTVVIGPAASAPAPLLLVHPINLRKECWLDVASRLAADRAVVMVDLDGHGESSTDGPFSLQGWIADTSDVLDALGLGRVHVAGGSLGGAIAVGVAGERPHRVVSATAIGSGLGGEQAGASPAGRLAEIEVAGLFAELAVEAVAPGAGTDVVRTVQHLTNAHGAEVVRSVLDAAWAADLAPWVPAVRCPVLVLTGEHDITDPPAAGRRLAAAVAGQHELLPGVGHLPMVEDPDTVVKLLGRHIEAAEEAA